MSLRLPLRARPSLTLAHLCASRSGRLFLPPSPTTLASVLRAAHSLPADLSSVSSSSSFSTFPSGPVSHSPVQSPKTHSPKLKSFSINTQPEVEVFAGPSRRRSYATTTDFERMPTRPPRPPPTPQAEVETFSAPSKPRAYYARPERDLPPLQRKWPLLLALTAIGSAAWGAFYLYAANQERLSSSVFKQVMTTVRDSDLLRDALGDAIRPEPVWWANGDPVVNGAIHLMQGTVDLSFRIKGHKGAGTLYFTSIRKAKGEPFSVLRFRVICDDGKVIEIPLRTIST